MECPDRDEEISLATRSLGDSAPEEALETVTPVLTENSIAECRETLQSLTLSDEIIGYAVDLVRATRTDESILAGAGPRATQALLLAGRARAAIKGYDFVTPDDLQALATAVIGPVCPLANRTRSSASCNRTCPLL